MEGLKDFFLGDTVTIQDYLYKTPHLIALACVAVSTLLLVFLMRNRSRKTKRIVLWVFVSILIAMEVGVRVIHFIKGGQFFNPKVIPMHFCSIMVWTIIVAAILDNKHVYSISAIGGLIATIAFLAHPGVGFDKEVLKAGQYYSIISHCLGFVVSVYLITGGFAKFRAKDVKATIVFLVVNYIYSFLLNFWLFPNENFLYYRENYLPVAFWVWILIYAGIIAVYVSSFYVITELFYRRKKRLDNTTQ